MNLRHIPLKGAYNLRDLGGYPTRDGRCTRWGLLYRSDALSGLTQEDWQVLIGRNIKTIIDLRSQSEASSASIQPPQGVAYYNVSLMPDLDRISQSSGVKSMSADQIMESMKLDYGKTVFGNLGGCAQVLDTITQRMSAGSIVFLCSAGKDRTGIIAALVLYLCGVLREDMIADYMVSSTYNTNGINRKMTALLEHMMTLISDPQFLKSILDSSPETIIKLLDELEAKDIRGALAQAGFPLAGQQQLKEQFTEAY